MTRRLFTLAAIGASAGAAVRFDEEMTNGDTAIRLIDATEDKGGPFMVGVRTSVKADQALVQVFYHVRTLVFGASRDLLLHKESIAPIAGNEGYGATADNFAIPRDQVQFIRVTFFKESGQVEFR
jgi:hypothetical protein